MFKTMFLILALSGVDSAERGDYDVALPLLNISEKEVPKELHHKFYFYKTVAEFQTLRKEEAQASLKKFWDLFDEPPKRYAVLAEGMQHDMNNWGKEPLGDIARKMGDVSRRLEQSRGGQLTQKKQQDIVKDLDRLIKEQEDTKNKAEADTQGNKQAPGQKPNDVKDPNSPAGESIVMGGKGEGKIDEKKLQQIAQTWGTLPPAKRAQIVQELIRELPPKFEYLIKMYFEALDKKHYNKP